MNRPLTIVSVCLLEVFLMLVAVSAQSVSEKAKRLQSSSIVVDTHDDTTQRLLDPQFDLAARHSDGNIDIPRMREGGLTAIFFSIWIPGKIMGPEAVQKALKQIDAVRETVRRHPKELLLATTAEDVRSAKEQNKIGALMGVEGGHMIGNDLSVLRTFAALGVRYMTLTHMENNEWADSSTAKPEHNGLTDFGKDVVREMNRIGMIVDISHVSDKTFYDVLQVTSKPVIASHSSCRSISDIPRNMTDDMMRALARNGGVVGINFGAYFLNQQDAGELIRNIAIENALEPTVTGAELDKFAAKKHAENGESHPHVGHATVEDAAACIDHVAKVAGVDHVGIGSDFDGIRAVPSGLEDISKIPNL